MQFDRRLDNPVNQSASQLPAIKPQVMRKDYCRDYQIGNPKWEMLILPFSRCLPALT